MLNVIYIIMFICEIYKTSLIVINVTFINVMLIFEQLHNEIIDNFHDFCSICLLFQQLIDFINSINKLNDKNEIFVNANSIKFSMWSWMRFRILFCKMNWKSKIVKFSILIVISNFHFSIFFSYDINDFISFN